MHNSFGQQMYTPSDMRIVVSEVLQSEEFCNQLKTPAATPIDELRRLFPSIRGPNNPEMMRRSIRSGHTFEKTKNSKNNKIITSDFQRDIILLKSETITHTLSGYKKSWAYENGYAMSAVTFKPSWMEQDIFEYIQNLFEEKLQGIKFEILIPMNRHLVKPNLPKGITLDGTIMRQLFNQKVVYVRSLSKITDEKESFVNDDIDVHVNGSDEISKSSAPKNDKYTGNDLHNNQSVLPPFASDDNILMELHDSDLIELQFIEDDLD
ncbi:hypothetical protein ABEB36_000167 [Hypothenemus hampei]|uniref:Uncharacterized protein n=1 Tax=Hypothenemus hampei TaxID=57062 RepID=A0ABD1FC99_HYPHA